MKVSKKLFCRTVQLGLRTALPILPYREPRKLHSIAELPSVLREEQAQAVLLITDSNIRRCGLTAPLEALLTQEQIRCIVYDKTVANPTDENVEEARALYLENGCGALIGFGGGSSMDCAKAAGARIAKPTQSLSAMGGVLRIRRRLPPLVAIPTTAGTGSEVTLAAVITDSRTHHKYPITDFCLIPRYAVLDPEITRSLPPFLTACTTMDALTHAIEAFIGRSTTAETRADAREAVRLIFANLDHAFQKGNDMTARRNLLQAAYLAGNAFSQSYVGYVHAVAHSLSGKYNLPHGYTNAVLLPWVLEGYGSAIYGKLHLLAVSAGVATPEDPPFLAADALIRAIRRMNRRFGIPERIQEIQSEDIPELARTADREANPLYPVPVLMDHRELERFYEIVKEGSYEPAGNPTDPSDAAGVFCVGADAAHGQPTLGSAQP